MSVEQIIGLVLVVVLMILGTIGAVLPGIPGTLLLPLAALGHKLYFGDAGTHWWVVIAIVLLTILTFVADYFATIWGTKRLGSTWRGAVGAVLGGIIGLFFGFIGIFFGPFVGAVLLELSTGRGWKASSKAGLGATLGLFVGALGKLALCIAMMGLFVVDVVGWHK